MGSLANLPKGVSCELRRTVADACFKYILDKSPESKDEIVGSRNNLLQRAGRMPSGRWTSCHMKWG